MYLEVFQDFKKIFAQILLSDDFESIDTHIEKLFKKIHIFFYEVFKKVFFCCTREGGQNFTDMSATKGVFFIDAFPRLIRPLKALCSKNKYSFKTLVGVRNDLNFSHTYHKNY